MDQRDDTFAGDRRVLDPVLRDQLETSLHGAYRFNAATAEYTVAWVWFAFGLKIASAFFAAVSAVVGIVLLLVGDSIQILTFDPLPYRTWFLWLTAAGAGTIAFFFFRMLHLGMVVAFETSTEMAKKYRAS